MQLCTQPKIIIAEDEQLLQSLLAKALEDEGLQVAATASNGEEVINQLHKLAVDAVLMDYRMPLMNGLEATKYITHNFPNVKVLMLSTYNKMPYVEEAITVGAKGYILKETSPNEIAEAIKTVVDGGNYFSASLLKKLSERTILPGTTQSIKLSLKDKAILKLLSMGYTADEISVRLGIKSNTLKAYLKNLRIKFNAKNSTHLILLAIQKGYLETDI